MRRDLWDVRHHMQRNDGGGVGLLVAEGEAILADCTFTSNSVVYMAVALWSGFCECDICIG